MNFDLKTEVEKKLTADSASSGQSTGASEDLSAIDSAKDSNPTDNVNKQDLPPDRNAPQLSNVATPPFDSATLRLEEPRNSSAKTSAATFGSNDCILSGGKQVLRLLTFAVVSVLLVSMSVLGNRIAWNKYTSAGIAAAQQHSFDASERYLLRALNEAEKFSNIDSRMASSLSNLGESYRVEGDLAKAEPLLLRGLQIREKLFGDKHPDVANSLISIGLMKEQRGEDPDQFYERALATRIKCLGTNHKDVASALVLIATVRAKHDPKSALPLFERALQIQVGANDPNRQQINEIIIGLVGLYAEDFVPKDSYERWLSMLASAKGHYEPEQVDLLVKIAHQTSTYEECCPRAAKLWSKFFSTPPNADDLSRFDHTFFQSWAQLSGVTLDHDFGLLYPSEEAVGVFKRELTMLEPSFGQHPLTAMVLNDLALCSHLSLAQREDYCRRAIRIWENFVPQHAELWKENISPLYGGRSIDLSIDASFLELAKIRGAKENILVHQQEEKMWEHALSPNSPKLAEILLHNSPYLAPPERERVFEKCANIWEKCLLSPSDKKFSGADSPSLESNLSCAELFFDQWASSRTGADALQVRRRQLALFEKAAGPNNVHVGIVLNSMIENGRLPVSQREELCRRTVEIWRSNLRSVSPRKYLSFADLYRSEPTAADISATFKVWASLHKGQRAEILDKQMDFWNEAADLDNPIVAVALNGFGNDATLSASARAKCLANAASVWARVLSSHRVDKWGHLKDMMQTFELWGTVNDGSTAELAYRKELGLLERFSEPRPVEVVAALRKLANVIPSGPEKIRLLSSAATISLKFMLFHDYSFGNHGEMPITLSMLVEENHIELLYKLVEQELQVWKKTHVIDSADEARLLQSLAQIDRVPLLHRHAFSGWAKPFKERITKHVDFTELVRRQAKSSRI